MCEGGFEPHRVEKKIKRNCPEEEEFKEEFGMAGSDSWHDYIDIADLFNTDGLFDRNSESEKVTQNWWDTVSGNFILKYSRLQKIDTFSLSPKIQKWPYGQSFSASGLF